MSQSKHAEARELMYSGALLFFSHGQVSTATMRNGWRGGVGWGVLNYPGSGHQWHRVLVSKETVESLWLELRLASVRLPLASDPAALLIGSVLAMCPQAAVCRAHSHPLYLGPSEGLGACC